MINTFTLFKIMGDTVVQDLLSGTLIGILRKQTISVNGQTIETGAQEAWVFSNFVADFEHRRIDSTQKRYIKLKSADDFVRVAFEDKSTPQDAEGEAILRESGVMTISDDFYVALSTGVSADKSQAVTVAEDGSETINPGYSTAYNYIKAALFDKAIYLMWRAEMTQRMTSAGEAI